MSSVKDLFYDIETMFIDGATNQEIAAELACPIEYVIKVLSTFGIDPEDFGVAEMPQGEYQEV